MNDTPSPPGWYTAPDNPVMVRYWDGEIWTESIRPAPNSAVGANGVLLKDHHVQTADAIDALLDPGETIEAGFRGKFASGRQVYAVATERRILFVWMRMVRNSRIKKVEEMSYDEIDTVGLDKNDLVGSLVVLTADKRTMSVGHSPNVESFAAYVQSRLHGHGTDIDLSSLPSPAAEGQAEAPVPLASTPAPTPTAAPARIGVADEIRKLAELQAEGLLTQAEFEGQKRRLLGL